MADDHLLSAPGALVSIALCIAARAAEVASPLSPADSLRHMQVDPGLTVELVACEPEVVDPIALRFDEDGRLWVIEMRDYPNGPQPGEAPKSQIRLLSDDDGDGRYETSRVFADQLLFPTGLQPWQGGLIVTVAGEVIYLRDDDGDGRADRRETWYRGFVAENPQLRANHPRFAFDHRVYVANGLRGGAVVDARVPAGEQKPIPISGMDFSFDPRTGSCQAVSGNGQFGLTFDDAGNRFTCNNRVPILQVVLENRYLARNPFLAVTSAVAEVAASAERSHVYPLTRAWTTSNLHAGQFTAACGVEIYRGSALGGDYVGNAFVCEPTGSLVHREVLERDGVIYSARRASERREFLASRDAWFRPVNLETGPDGALYVVDMYRAVIEHPQYMPSELQGRPDLRLGDDRGRIYRVVRAGQAKSRPAPPRLSKATSLTVVATLDHPDAWSRETASRLLCERQDRSPAVVDALRHKAISGASAPSRAAALAALDSIAALDDATLARALDDTDPTVRQHAVRMAEPRLPNSPELRKRVIERTADRDGAVLFRVALALGDLEGPEVVEALAQIGVQRAADPWTRLAVASGRGELAAPLMSAIVEQAGLASKGAESPELALVIELATVVGSRRDVSEIARLLAGVVDAEPTLCRAVVLAAARGLERRGDSLKRFLVAQPRSVETWTKLASVFDRSADDAANESLPESQRIVAIDLLKYAATGEARERLLTLVTGSPQQTVRIRAAAALAGQAGDEIGAKLLADYANQTPAIRRAIVDTLMGDPAAARLLLAAVESGRVSRQEIDAPHEARLAKHPDSEVRALAARLLTREPPAERKAVLADYRASLELKSDPVRGKDLFRKHCAACHHIGDVGVDVAPDISDSRVKTAEQLLVDILNPNQAIDNNYVSYTVATRDGTVHTGIITSETAASVTLKSQEAKTESVLRADIDSITTAGQSLMPEGFERSLAHQDMADLISFVKNWRYLAERIPGVSPAP